MRWIEGTMGEYANFWMFFSSGKNFGGYGWLDGGSHRSHALETISYLLSVFP